jgi:hypothetical protein
MLGDDDTSCLASPVVTARGSQKLLSLTGFVSTSGKFVLPCVRCLINPGNSAAAKDFAMAIELQCPNCQNRLRVPDESAGRNARCPACKTIVPVPSESPAAAPTSFNSTPAIREPATFNPYSPPTIDAAPKIAGQTLSLGVIDPNLALSTAWNQLKRYGGVLVGAFIIQILASFAMGLLLGIMTSLVGNLAGDPRSPLVVLTEFGGNLSSQLVQYFFAIGFIKLSLAAIRNEQPTISLFFSGTPQLLRYLGGIILFSLATIIGFVLLIVPGVYVILTYWSFMYFIVDRDAGVLESFRLAKQHAPNNRMPAFVLGIMAFGLGILSILTCGIGFLVAVPLINLTIAAAWLMMTGQTYARQGTL